MIHFECDYAEGALPHIMDLMMKTNMEQTSGYGVDPYCERARDLVREACGAPDAAVYFVVGGTQANKIMIQSVLKPYEGAIAATTGHINVHETGTIEAGGHKVLTIPTTDGKITADRIRKVAAPLPGDYHVVQAGCVYISNPTETGTLYSKKELEEIRKACDEYDLYLLVDGARMAYGMGSSKNDLTLNDYARLCDVFYIGATKCGALFGEGIVIPNKKIRKELPYHIKQNGALLAKGRLLGLQFIGLFDEEKLFFKVGDHAGRLADKLSGALKDMGFEFKYDSPTNQIFPIMTNELLDKLKGKYVWDENSGVDENRRCVRFCTSWATKEEDVDTLIDDLKALI